MFLANSAINSSHYIFYSICFSLSFLLFFCCYLLGVTKGKVYQSDKALVKRALRNARGERTGVKKVLKYKSSAYFTKTIT